MCRYGIRLTTALAGASLIAVSACGGFTSTQGENESCTQDQKTGAITVHLNVSPCPVHAGQPSTANVTVKDGSGVAVRNAEVTIGSAMEAMKMAGGSVKAEEQADGYRAKVLLGMSGPWDLYVQVSVAGSASDTHFVVHAR